MERWAYMHVHVHYMYCIVLVCTVRPEIFPLLTAKISTKSGIIFWAPRVCIVHTLIYGYIHTVYNNLFVNGSYDEYV